MRIRWTINVSEETDRDLRVFLAERGTKKGDLSKFVEEAIQERLYQLAIAEAQARNAELGDEAAADLADEAVAWARKHKKQAA
jgi:hypothetical protein